MKKLLLLCLITAVIAVNLSLTGTSPETAPAGRTVLYCKEGAVRFAKAITTLQQAVSRLEKNDTVSVLNARQALKDCRLEYKSISFLFSYFFPSETALYNMPARLEIEEPYMEYQEPSGLQVIEALLYDSDPAAHKTALLDQTDLMLSSANDLPALFYQFSASDGQLLECIRLELVRVLTLYISGFDAPYLKTGIGESRQALVAIRYNLQPFLEKGDDIKDSIVLSLNKTCAYLEQHDDFDSFNRLYFLTQLGLPLQRQLGKMITASGLEINTVGILNYKAEHLFKPDALTITAFPGEGFIQNKALIALGQQLFFDKVLSGNQARSCATCHRPDQYFASHLVSDTAFDNHTLLPRNTPALLYTGYQHSQFWDGRARTLEQQIREVLRNPMEMNVAEKALPQLLKQSGYSASFSKAFSGVKEDSLLSVSHTAAAIAAFIRTLPVMTSNFDRYMLGDSLALTPRQQLGANLFMGKAQCATCHFAPLFNGLTPPLYERTEFEILGTPRSESPDRPEADNDPGRYAVFPISFYKQAFKTPSIRNAAVTAPYMHNGQFSTLEKLIDFYNAGGATGRGIKTDNQTLSAEPLHLNETEKKALVAFMEALTDK